MKTSKYTEEQIVYALRQVEAGEAVVEVCRRLGISQQTFYSWKKKYGGGWLDGTQADASA